MISTKEIKKRLKAILTDVEKGAEQIQDKIDSIYSKDDFDQHEDKYRKQIDSLEEDDIHYFNTILPKIIKMQE